MAGRKRNSEANERLLSVRISESLLARLERYAEKIERDRPGVRVSRSDLVRSLLLQALERELNRLRRL